MADVIQLVNEPLLIEVWQGNDWTTVSYGEDVTVYGNIGFISLCDVPHTYEGQAGKAPVVKDDETGLEFQDIIGNKFTNLKDCPNTYQNCSGRVVRVKKDETGLEFVNTVKDVTIIPFTDLADVPPSYEGASNKLVQVSPGENGLEFNSIEDVLPNKLQTVGRFPFATVTVDNKGRITAIEAGKAGTILPDYDNTHLLTGDGTDVPVEFQNADTENKFLTTKYRISETGRISYPTWDYISQLYNIRGLLALDATNDGSSSYYLQVHSSSDGITIVPRSISDSGQNVNLNLIPQGRGALNLGNSSTSGIHANTIVNMHNNTITADSTITLQPKGEGTVRVNPSQLITASYTENVVNVNDLTNKGYVDKAIQDAISGMDVDKGMKATIPATIRYNTSEVLLGTLHAGSFIDEVRLIVDVPFSESAYITIGDDIDNDSVLERTYLPRSGVYTIDVYNSIVRDTAIKAYIYTRDATQGTGVAYIKYFA